MVRSTLLSLSRFVVTSRTAVQCLSTISGERKFIRREYPNGIEMLLANCSYQNCLQYHELYTCQHLECSGEPICSMYSQLFGTSGFRVRCKFLYSCFQHGYVEYSHTVKYSPTRLNNIHVRYQINEPYEGHVKRMSHYEVGGNLYICLLFTYGGKSPRSSMLTFKTDPDVLKAVCTKLWYERLLEACVYFPAGVSNLIMLYAETHDNSKLLVNGRISI